ncbi:UNVERIFIED_CONTAM: hypothetical protein GTU68_038199 [Idotea baltica]|nr:hypothetical protein [Idotea baltica]
MSNNTIALIAHDRTKPDLLEWVERHVDKIKPFTIIATGTTGGLIRKAHPDLTISTVKSGPLGGDQQVGAMIASGEIDIMIFLEDVMTAQPHDVDIKALLRLAVLYELPLACNRITADLLMENIDMALAFRAQYPHPEQKHLEYLQRNV